MGGDRELVVLAAIFCVIIGLSLGTFKGFILAVGMWLFFLYWLQKMGRADPLMRRVYLRHVRYASWYSAKAGLYSRALNLPPSWKADQ